LKRNPTQHILYLELAILWENFQFIFVRTLHRKTRHFILLLALTQETCKIKEKLIQLHYRVTFSSSAGSKKRQHADREHAYT